MMGEQYHHRALAWWTSGQTGLTQSSSAPTAIHFTAPAEFGGLEGRWTPEDLLLSALASCFTTTFHRLAAYAKLEYLDLEVEAEGTTEKADSGYKFGGISLCARVRVPNEDAREQATTVLEKAESLCLVSRALASPPIFQLRVEVGKGQPVA
ncbi:MAG TPA: OsmC family protein [Terriglobales bacterium]|nr:OsmC family protein [Terriglobales bacterium]